MPCSIDPIPGQRFGKLTIIDVERKYGHKYYKCSCACGNPVLKSVRKDHLLNGDISSCGCNYFDRTHSTVDKPTYKVFKDFAIGNTFDCREFVIDFDDLERVTPYNWYFDQYGYVVATINKKAIKLHQFILNKPNSKIDHRDRNKANNRKENLRICSDSENSVNRGLGRNNSSGVIGVGYVLKVDKWRARICVNKKQIFLGQFDSFEDAVKARLKAEQKYFKEFAPQKHLYSKYLK